MRYKRGALRQAVDGYGVFVTAAGVYHDHRAPGAVEWLLCPNCGLRGFWGVEGVPCPSCGEGATVGCGWLCCCR